MLAKISLIAVWQTRQSRQLWRRKQGTSKPGYHHSDVHCELINSKGSARITSGSGVTWWMTASHCRNNLRKWPSLSWAQFKTFCFCVFVEVFFAYLFSFCLFVFKERKEEHKVCWVGSGRVWGRGKHDQNVWHKFCPIKMPLSREYEFK